MDSVIDPEHARRVLRDFMLKHDWSHKQLADRLSRSVATVKRALNGNIGERTAYKILAEFGRAEAATVHNDPS